jgi:hypothetical protein
LLVFQAEWSCRPAESKSSLGNKGIQVTTLWYRAPELLYGDVRYGRPIDAFSLGMVMLEVAGAAFHKQSTEAKYRTALFDQFGAPPSSSMPSWPLFPQVPPKTIKAPWPDVVRTCLPENGIAMVDGLCAWDPAKRPLLGGALGEHSFLHPEQFALGGWLRSLDGALVSAAAARYEGKRHRWNVLEGHIAPEVLDFLRQDPALIVGTPEFMSLGVDFAADRPDVKTEEGRKFILSGYLGNGGHATESCCGKSMKNPLPLKHFQSWHRAFVAANLSALEALRISAKKRLYHMEEADLGKNGRHFMDAPLSQWFMTCGQLMITAAGSGPTLWDEPSHNDGGASVLHIGVTLYGRRRCRCLRGGALADIIIPCRPGSVYLGGLTGPTHQACTETNRVTTITPPNTTTVCG